MGDNLATDVHERMDQLVESACHARKSNDKGRAIEVFIGKVKEGHDAVVRQYPVTFGVSLQTVGDDRTFHEACADRHHFRRHIMSVAFRGG